MLMENTWALFLLQSVFWSLVLCKKNLTYTFLAALKSLKNTYSSHFRAGKNLGNGGKQAFCTLLLLQSLSIVSITTYFIGLSFCEQSWNVSVSNYKATRHVLKEICSKMGPVFSAVVLQRNVLGIIPFPHGTQEITCAVQP